MARVTSSPAAQQPKLTSHSAQAGAALVREPSSTTSSWPRPRGHGAVSTAAVRERYGPRSGPRNCHRCRLRWDNAATASPED
jgi:hypothetical protein